MLVKKKKTIMTGEIIWENNLNLCFLKKGFKNLIKFMIQWTFGSKNKYLKMLS